MTLNVSSNVKQICLSSDGNVRWPRRVLPLVSHVQYMPRALLRLEKDGTDRRTDGRQTVTFRLPLDTASVIKKLEAKRSINRKCMSCVFVGL